MQNDLFKNAFNRFTHNPVETDEEKEKNKKKVLVLDTTEKIKEMKFKNPHLNISNEITNNSLISIKDSMSSLNSSNIENKMQRENISNISSIENKYIKMKKQSNLSSSTSSLMRQYKASNLLNNSSSSGLGFYHKKNSSSVNL